LTPTSPLKFLERYSFLGKCDELTYSLSRYLIELSLIECKMMKYLPSNLAASAIFLSKKILSHSAWNETL